MKKIIFFLLMLFTFYWAGMYHSLPLMALCMAELLLFVILLLLPRVLRRQVSVTFPKQNETARANVETVCRVILHNKGKLPVGRVGLRLHVWYAQDSKGIEKKIYGGAAYGESSMEFGLCPAYCGLLQVRIDRLRVYDYLSLFSSAKKTKEDMNVAIFPGEQALRITLSKFGWDQSGAPEEQTVSRPGDSYNEIRQIREYRIGDPGRHIHRNLSAKTDQLWVKEYEKDTDLQADILLDLTGLSEASTPEKSAFYQLLSALVLGLLKEMTMVRVHWHVSDGESSVHTNISNEEQCWELLLSLYQADFLQDEEPAEASEKAEAFGKSVFRLTTDLSLFAGDTLLHRFSAEKLEQEIQEKGFVI